MLSVPESFAEEVVRREGEPGRAWLDTLPGLAARYCLDWKLTPDGATMHGCAGLALPVTRTDGTPAILKLSWLDADTRDEPLALSTWHGDGAVLLLDSDSERGAMLLERLDPARSLQTEPLAEATEIAAGLLRRLAVAAPAALRDLRTLAADLVTELPAEWERLGRRLPRRLVDAAVGLCRELGPESGSLLVNQDLHYQNVLAGTREPWLVIDPQAIAGDVEFGTISLLWNRMRESTVEERFTAVVSAAGLDAGRARAWTLVRAVQNWLWTLDGGGYPLGASLDEIAHWAAQDI